MHEHFKSQYPYDRTRSQALLEELNRYVIADPFPFVVNLKESQDMWLATVDGDRIFDWAGYYGSKLIGHNHPRLYRPEYLERLAVAANNKIANPDFLTPECLDYYRTLHAWAPQLMKSGKLEVYVVNSGAEAVENMMKYFINLYDRKMLTRGAVPSMRRFIYFDQAFHGRTVFALNITKMSHAPVVTRDFHGFVSGNIEIPFPAIDTTRSDSENHACVQESLRQVEAALQQYGCEVIGIIVEPLQGAGGQRTTLPEFFRGLSSLAHSYGVALGFDEVQTAGGCTGSFFAVDQFDLPHPPQAVASGKKLGNGVVYMIEPMEDRGVLDSTWGGSLTDMVRVVEELKIVKEERLIEAVPAKQEVMVRLLNDLARRYPQVIHNVRGLGIYQGFSAADAEMRNELICRALDYHGLLLLGASTHSIRLRPPLTVTEEDILHLHQELDQVLCYLSKKV
jgi:L-lysine 6-transaminase